MKVKLTYGNGPFLETFPLIPKDKGVIMATATARPAVVTDEHLEYLDELRESGVTNMFGGAAYLQREFGLDRRDSKVVLMYWMASFNERHGIPPLEIS
jgi:hypothetical protein